MRGNKNDDDGDESTVRSANVDVTMKVNGNGGSVELDVRKSGDVPPRDEAGDMPPMPSYEGPGKRLLSYAKENKWYNKGGCWFFTVLCTVSTFWGMRLTVDPKAEPNDILRGLVFIVVFLIFVMNGICHVNLLDIDFNLKILDTWEECFSAARGTMPVEQTNRLYDTREKLLRDRYDWVIGRNLTIFASVLFLFVFFRDGTSMFKLIFR